MNSSDQRRTKRALSRLPKSRKIVLYFELLFRLAWYRLSEWWRYSSPRARIHWLGRHPRPRRLERSFIAFVLVGGIFVLDTHQLLLWSLGWGGLASAFVITKSFSMVFQK